MPHVYILKCSDGSYYVDSTADLARRLFEHQNGLVTGYTESRRPVELVWSAELPTEHDAFLRERQIKGWSRAKKEALIRGEWNTHGRQTRTPDSRSEETKEADVRVNNRILRLRATKRCGAPLRMLRASEIKTSVLSGGSARMTFVLSTS